MIEQPPDARVTNHVRSSKERPAYRTIRRFSPEPNGETVAEMLAWLDEQGVPPSDARIQYATLSYDRPENAEERAQREASEARQRERTESWERETYERLRSKYEG